jgi:glycine cleavage system regulatory protein
MLTTVVITIFGPDRPGLVEAVAGRVAAHGGNWLESRLLHLGGYFTGIVRVEVDETRLGELLVALRAQDGPELRIVVHDTRDADAAGAPATRSTAALEVIGHDRPGIVRAISRVLAERGVNVEELATERSSAPMSGEPMFQARATLALPSGCDTAQLRGELEKIATDLMVDVRLTPAR